MNHKTLLECLAIGAEWHPAAPFVNRAMVDEAVAAGHVIELERNLARKKGPKVACLSITPAGRQALVIARKRPRKAKTTTLPPLVDPLTKLATVDLVAHLKVTKEDWVRGYRIMASRWPGHFQTLTDFERQMGEAITASRRAAGGRADVALLCIEPTAMVKGHPYLVTGGSGGVWLARGPLPGATEGLRVYRILLP